MQLLIVGFLPALALSVSSNDRSASEGPLPLKQLPQLPPSDPSVRPAPTRTQSLPTTLHPHEGWNLRLHQRVRVQDMVRGRESERAVARLRNAPDFLRQGVGAKLRLRIAAFGSGRHVQPPALFAAVHSFEERLRHDLADVVAEHQRFKAEAVAAGRALDHAHGPRNVRYMSREERRQRTNGSRRLYARRRKALEALWRRARTEAAPLQVQLAGSRAQIARMRAALQQTPATHQMRTWDLVLGQLADARVQRLQDLCAAIASMGEDPTGNFLERTDQLLRTLDRRAARRRWVTPGNEDRASHVGITAAGWDQWAKSQLPTHLQDGYRPVYERPGWLTHSVFGFFTRVFTNELPCFWSDHAPKPAIVGPRQARHG